MRVLISDARQSVRHALELLLQQANWFVIDTVATPQELIVKATELRPELVLLDWELGGASAGKTLVAQLHAMDFHPLVVVISIDPETRTAALTSGSEAFISKNDSAEQILYTLEAVMHPNPKS